MIIDNSVSGLWVLQWVPDVDVRLPPAEPGNHTAGHEQLSDHETHSGAAQ